MISENTKEFQDALDYARTLKARGGNLEPALDENLMRETFEMAHQDYLDGHFVSNSQVVDYIKGELGWK